MNNLYANKLDNLYKMGNLVSASVGLRGGWNCSLGIRDGKADFPDSSFCLEAVITNCTSDPRKSLPP